MSNRTNSGKARAESLTPEQRKAIASKAAAARWNVPEATHEGSITVGEVVIPCAVLQDGTRVLTQSGFMKALGRARQAKGRQYYNGDVNLPAFLTAKNLKPFINSDLEVASSQVEFRTAKGAKAFGYAADLLPQVCEVFLRARDAGALLHSQAHIGIQADILIRGLARVGIAALVDEATGYQEIRDRAALQAILDKYLTDEYAKWTKTFPDEFYMHLFRLKGLDWPVAKGQKPQYVGHWTNQIIYDRLAPGIKDELKRKNPRAESGNRKRKHHQHLTKDFGHPEATDLIRNVTFMLKGAPTWEIFIQMLDAARPKHGDTLPMDLR